MERSIVLHATPADGGHAARWIADTLARGGLDPDRAEAAAARLREGWVDLVGLLYPRPARRPGMLLLSVAAGASAGAPRGQRGPDAGPAAGPRGAIAQEPGPEPVIEIVAERSGRLPPLARGCAGALALRPLPCSGIDGLVRLRVAV